MTQTNKYGCFLVTEVDIVEAENRETIEGKKTGWIKRLFCSHIYRVVEEHLPAFEIIYDGSYRIGTGTEFDYLVCIACGKNKYVRKEIIERIKNG